MADAVRRSRLNRDRVLRAAVDLADAEGIDATSMRNLAERLGVVPMALYKHVANKDELLDGMVDVIIGEIDVPGGLEWRAAVRGQILAARRVMLAHPWARHVLESRTNRTLAVLGYMDRVAGFFLAGGFSADLAHHVMHALGSRIWGFSPELFDDKRAPVGPREVDTEAQAEMLRHLAARYPSIAEISRAAMDGAGADAHKGCDEQFEFEFALDVLLDGFERLHQSGWTSRR